MPIAICGVHEVPAFAAIPLDHIVSIRESHQHGPDISGFQGDFTLHRFVFADTGDPANPLAASEQQVRRLLDICAQTRADQNILFHCFAGVSRSSAAAFLWLVGKGMPYADAFQTVINIRGPFVSPNELMVRLADPLMGHGGKMAEFVTAELGRRAPERAAWFAAHQ